MALSTTISPSPSEDSDMHAFEADFEEKYNPRDLVLTVCPLKSQGEVPRPRCGHSLSLIGNKIFLFGGADSDTILGDSYVTTVANTKWEVAQTTGFSCPGPLFGHTATVVDAQLYVFGGLTLSSTYKFEADYSGSSDAAPPMGILSEAKQSSYSGPRVTLFKKREEESTNEFYTFDLATMQWAQPHAEGDAPCQRFLHSACLMGRNIVIFGGCRDPSYKRSLNDVIIFNLDKGEWSRPSVKGDVPSPRHGHSATDIGNGVMLVFGGANEDTHSDNGKMFNVQRYNDVHLLDTKTWTWTRGLTIGSPPLPRAFHAAGVVGDDPRLLYVFAGETHNAQSDLCVLDLTRMKWGRPLYDGTFDLEMHSAVVFADKLISFGGLSISKSLQNDFSVINTVTIRPAADNDLTFKIILAGNSEVGKSCLMTRFVEDRYADIHVSTIGVDFKTVTTMVDGRVVKLHIWDTAGQERFAAVTAHYYRGADGAVLVFDVTNPQSFDGLDTWNAAIDDANSVNDKEVLKLVVGNKCDLAHQRKIEASKGKEWCKKHNGEFCEASARDSTNVDFAFLSLARKLVQRAKKDKVAKTTARGNGASQVRLSKTSMQGGKSEKCCA